MTLASKGLPGHAAQRALMGHAVSMAYAGYAVPMGSMDPLVPRAQTVNRGSLAQEAHLARMVLMDWTGMMAKTG